MRVTYLVMLDTTLRNKGYNVRLETRKRFKDCNVRFKGYNVRLGMTQNPSAVRHTRKT